MNDPAIDAVIVETGVDLTDVERAALGTVLDRVRSGEFGPAVDGNDDRMRDYREAGWAAVKAELSENGGAGG